MSEVGEAIDEVRAEVAEAAADFMLDLCTIVYKGAVTNAPDGTYTEGETTLANVPCELEPLSAYERQTGGGNLGGYADYKLSLPYFWNGAALSVPANASITIAARGLNPQRTLTVVGPLYSSSEPFLAVAVKLEG